MIFPNRIKNNPMCFFLCLLPFSGVFQSTLAQDLSVDDIIKKNIEARGGTEAWEKIKTIKMTGTYVNFSNPEDFVIYRQRPDLYRFDTTRLHLFTIHAFDGKSAWWVNPLMGEEFSKPAPIPTNENLAKVTLRERFFEPIFWNYQTKGNQVENLGKESIDGEEVYKLKITLQDKTEEYWYLSTSSFLELSMSGITYDFGVQNNLEVFFSDYRKVDSIILPFLVESEYGIRYRSLEVKAVEINGSMDPSVFKMPVPEIPDGK